MLSIMLFLKGSYQKRCLLFFTIFFKKSHDYVILRYLNIFLFLRPILAVIICFPCLRFILLSVHEKLSFKISQYFFCDMLN